MTTHQNINAVVLAAGKGTRMKSAKAKVLHEVFFKPMVHHVLDAIHQTGVHGCSVIIGHQREQVEGSLSGYDVSIVLQEEQLGTGHAVLCAEKKCSDYDTVMILCGDTPLIRPQTLGAMISQHHQSGSVLTPMTTFLDNPFGYGRIISDQDDNVTGIVEQKDATEQQRIIREINAGIYLVDREFLFTALKQVGTDNAQGEVYLTDIVTIACRLGHKVHKFMHPNAIDVLGVNSRIELAQAHQELQKRRNEALMLQGVTIFHPESVQISPDAVIGRDTVVHPGVRISGHSSIGNDCVFHSGVQIDNCRIGDRVIIGAHGCLKDTCIDEDRQIPPLTVISGSSIC